MKGCMSTDLGIITIDPEVIAKYAGTVAVECFGIVGMAAVNMKDGLVHVSQMTDRYIKHPLEAVSVGDIVEVKVLAVDVAKKRISLTMKIRETK